MYATCANLLNYPDSSGHRGNVSFVPRLQRPCLPSRPMGARTAFNIRRGFRFSPPSNEEVTAQTFRHTIERALSPKNIWSDGPRLASDIAGVSAYRTGKAGHISGLAVHGSAFSITLTKPAGDFLTRISMPAFCPVPLSGPSPRKRAVADADPVCWAVLHLLVRRTPNRARAKPQLFRRTTAACRANRLQKRHPDPAGRCAREHRPGRPTSAGLRRHEFVVVARRSPRPAVRSYEHRRESRRAAVLLLSRAIRRLHRLQHAPTSVPERPPSPCRQLRTRPPRARCGVRRRSRGPDRAARGSRIPGGTCVSRCRARSRHRAALGRRRSAVSRPLRLRGPRLPTLARS